MNKYNNRKEKRKSTRKNGSLDAIGTSQKYKWSVMREDVPSKEYEKPLKREIDQMRERLKGEKCINDAPYICIPKEPGKEARIFQGCCNSWNCPRCGLMRANEEFARICKGAYTLSKEGYKFYEMTITCKGKVTTEEAEKEYPKATNRLLSSLRAQVKKEHGFWAYCQVTERQKRKHPHSHFICTFIPKDAFYIDTDEGYAQYKLAVNQVNEQIPDEMKFRPKKQEKVNEGDMFSIWLCLSCVKAGLGVQCHISIVRSLHAMTNYLAKYMFKSALETSWPKSWKRIRYSQNWPKLDKESNPNAFPVLRREDWDRVARMGCTVYTDDPNVYEVCLLRGCYNVRCTVENHIDIDIPPEKPPPRSSPS